MRRYLNIFPYSKVMFSPIPKGSSSSPASQMRLAVAFHRAAWLQDEGRVMLRKVLHDRFDQLWNLTQSTGPHQHELIGFR